MADYSDLMKLEKKAKPPTPSVDTPPSPTMTDTAKSASLLANQQTNKPAKKLASLPVNQLASKSVNQQTSKLANQQTTKEKKKYGTYLREGSISAIQMLAIQTKRKDHEVLQDIVDAYFASEK